MSNEFLIDETEITKSRRGRVATVNEDLIAILKAMKPGVKGKNAARLDSVFGSVEVSKRAGISGQIKAHAARVHGVHTDAEGKVKPIVSVDYAPTVYGDDGETIVSGGFPQVRFNGKVANTTV